MSAENVKKFYEAVSRDEALKQKFIELSQKYQGQPMNEAKMQAIAEKEVLTLAAQMGYPFTMDDLNAYGEEMKQAHMNRELNDEELQAVTGGGASLICAVLGFNEGFNHVNGFGYCLLLGFNAAGGFCFLIGAGTKG